MNKKQLATLIPLLVTTASYATIETSLGKANVDLRLRFETVSQDNALDDATAFTLRTKANFKTNAHNGFYGTVASWGKDSEGEYIQLGYDTEIGGFDAGIALIFNDEDTNVSDDVDSGDDQSIIFTIGKSFDL